MDDKLQPMTAEEKLDAIKKILEGTGESRVTLNVGPELRKHKPINVPPYRTTKRRMIS